MLLTSWQSLSTAHWLSARVQYCNVPTHCALLRPLLLLPCAESLVAQAGPGGAYEHTLLVVLSDHGQTLGGDHGGGTPDETDSILVAMSLRLMNETLQQQQNTAAGRRTQHDQRSGHRDSQVLQELMHAGGYTDTQQQGGGATASSSEADAGAAAGCMDDAAETCASNEPSAVQAPALSDLMVCRNTVPQIDLTPLLAYLLGVPIPFGNLGKMPPHLFAALAAPQGSSTEASLWLPQYSAALSANAAQVNSYLNRYAAVGGLPAAQLASVNARYASLQQQQQAVSTSPPGSQKESPIEQQPDSVGPASGNAAGLDDSAELQHLVAAQLSYLAAAADLARRRFTLFQQGPIWAGCLLGVLLLVAQLLYLRCGWLTKCKASACTYPCGHEPEPFCSHTMHTCIRE